LSCRSGARAMGREVAGGFIRVNQSGRCTILIESGAIGCYGLPMPFRSLDAQKILSTTETLERRIAERFPVRGLTQVAAEVTELGRKAMHEVRDLGPPIWGLRFLVAAVVLAGAVVFLWVGSVIPLHQVGRDAIASVEGVEAAINTVLLAALGLLALVRLEARVKRQKVARSLHELRSVIHVIDMHQLTKDPVTLSPDFRPTETSPARTMTAAEMSRYLDYCSELLAITGKLAALYSQAVPDEGVASAVNDIELLGSSLSRKIWQKITLIEQAAPGRGRRMAQ
jgi:signal transduction histidine kinase